MPVVEESIPEALETEVDASLAWFNAQEDMAFEVTGIVDPKEALTASGDRALRLILCGGDRCEQHSFRVVPDGDGYAVSFLDDPARQTEVLDARLDPPPGARRSWLDGVLGRNAFTFLVFYRGYW
jgi:hypothetical protein